MKLRRYWILGLLGGFLGFGAGIFVDEVGFTPSTGASACALLEHAGVV